LKGVVAPDKAALELHLVIPREGVERDEDITFTFNNTSDPERGS